jgi:hypothetical protein
MDFYFDENLPKLVAQALDILEKKWNVNRVYSTEETFGKEIKDCPLIKKLKEVNGIWITCDQKIITRSNEFQLIQEQGLTVFIIVLPGKCNFSIIYQDIISKWEDIKEICSTTKHPFVCKAKRNGSYQFL